MRTGRYQSWWQIDLGKRIKLRPNYYSVRHDSSDEFMRNWELRGSTDGSHWTTLRTHENDGTINKPLQCASWPVPGVGARTREGEGEGEGEGGWTIFRVVSTGPNASACNPHRLCMTYLELYGVLESY